MQRYFLANEAFNESSVKITGDDAKHIGRVMRMESGDTVICCTYEGDCYEVSLTSVEQDAIDAKVIRKLLDDPELPVHVTVAQGLPKGDKLETIVQKGTELGAASFIPVTMDRSIVKWQKAKQDKKRQRLEKIAKEASEQSHRRIVPHIKDLATTKELSQAFSNYDHVFVAYEETAKKGEQHLLSAALTSVNKQDKILLVIGPEGGFSPEEIEQMVESGATCCAFGPRILRTETASMYGLSVISYQLEILG
ncbi:16S rRNA (uracil(1498)-N(3))-methyltransferase [Texcoconibacillus texcoconensis]|uniref:Ribosomal RNA small subunit methyltransferase E n=1 Tax=Texcoconibacillus texcoconensis TaxID=1095777 RepID=A0A840QRI8_9BACI|nr:16S rRNA (uracil(1498)-N(3))-methyltransferase [Texcoconibacillus texcoconensis]MBB5173948.1 16S rRNA (uracil1498-N3)-methyltransferase [Texcoconibacillus texcoconensis]